MPVWDITFQFVLLGSVLIGCTSGVLGTFAVLRKRSLLGDALAHAALPGVALAFMLTQSKALPVLLAGATMSGVVGVLLIQVIVNQTRIKADAALGIVLSVFFWWRHCLVDAHSAVGCWQSKWLRQISFWASGIHCCI